MLIEIPLIRDYPGSVIVVIESDHALSPEAIDPAKKAAKKAAR